MGQDHKADFDVAIIGGSYAGMAAALQLARAHRSVCILDAGLPRNRFASKAHGFLTRDGVSPKGLSRAGREQLEAYPTISWKEATVGSIRGERDEFTVLDESGEEVTTRLLILATGVTDHLPEIDGLQERWGDVVFNCPYCHGYELEKGRIAVIATEESSFDQAMMLPEWGQVTLFLNGVLELDEVQTRALEIKDVTIENTVIKRITNRATIELEDDRALEFNGIAVSTDVSISDLVSQLGCELEKDGGADYVKVGDDQATSVEGVFAGGDLARTTHNIPFAVADGSMAGSSAHSLLLETD